MKTLTFEQNILKRIYTFPAEEHFNTLYMVKQFIVYEQCI
jgi:hypothetical protein